MLDQIMNPYVNIHNLLLTQGNSYIELPEWIAKEKAVINQKKKKMNSALNGVVM